MGTAAAPPPALDPDGLLACTREVYWWAETRTNGVAHWAAWTAMAGRGIEPSGFRWCLLDAWALASTSEHSALRLGFPGYAAAMLMFGLKGVDGVRELLDSLEADLVDLAAARRARS